MRTRLHVLLAWLLIFPAQSLWAGGEPPDTVVKTTVNEVLDAVRQTKDKQALRAIAEQKVLPHFDFNAMTRLAVGRAWRSATQEQQRALENGFRSLLVSTYVAALSVSATGRETVEVRPLRTAPADDEVTVKTVAKAPGNEPIAIDYRMKRTADDWKVVDVVVENLSLVTNYRGTFSSEIARSGIDGLIKALDDKNRRLAAG